MTGAKRDSRELAHISVNRVSGSIEAEDQGAVPARSFGVRHPFAGMLKGRVASEARVHIWVEGVASDGDGMGTEERDGGHFGEQGRREISIGGGL